MPKKFMMITAAGLALASAGAMAQERGYYVSGSAGVLYNADSGNSGQFNSVLSLDTDFDGGEDAALNPGAGYTFDTDFGIGSFISLAIGKNTSYGPFRSELELSAARVGVKDHSNFQALGGNLSEVDVGVVLGEPAPVGLSLGRTLEDTQGSAQRISFMVNSYYDIELEGGVTPYLGAGIGVSRVQVEYQPSGIDFVDDTETKFSWQLMAGVDYELNQRDTLQTGVRYFSAGEVDVDADFTVGGAKVFDSDLAVETDQFMVELGWRRKF